MKVSLIVILLILATFAGKSQQIKGFTLPNVADGRPFSLAATQKAQAVVVIFFSGKCAYGRYYIGRITSLMQAFSGQGVRFVLINANSSDYVPEESVAAMQAYARKHQLPVYLADKEQQVKQLLSATRTPEALVLKPEGGYFSIVYRGAIDDSPQRASDVSHAYLKAALLNLLAGKHVTVNQTRPVGCLIK